MMNKGSLFIVTGPSGAGKGAVLGGLQRTMDNVFYSISSVPKRALRSITYSGINEKGSPPSNPISPYIAATVAFIISGK